MKLDIKHYFYNHSKNWSL